jgi:hypothetical protein
VEQRFNKGDWVRIAKDLGPSMRHFQADREAIVIASYHEQFGGGEDQKQSYTLHLKGRGRVSWYDEHQLTLIETGRHDKLAKWEAEEAAEATLKSSHDWIFEHGAEVLAEAHGATVATLARDVGITNLWGSRGEGYTYYQNALGVISHASPFLKKGDKAGWLVYAVELKRKIADERERPR